MLVIGTLLVFGIVFSQSWFNLAFLRPNTSEQTLILAALSAIIFLLLLALTFVLARNLLKLFAERRLGVLGSKFRTRMVVGSLVLSSVPVILLCFFAYGLLNRSIVKWYSSPAEKVNESTAAVTNMLERYAGKNADAEARAIAAAPETQQAFASGNFTGLVNELRHHEVTLEDGFALALSCPAGQVSAASVSGCTSEASFRAPAPWPILQSSLVVPRPGEVPAPFEILGRLYMIGVAPVGQQGMIVTALPLPAEFTQTLNDLQASRAWYVGIAAQLKQVRRSYIGILLLVTVLLLFASMWLAMFVAKLVTRPVAALAEATQEISRGNLDYRVAVRAADELGDLVAKFNRMAAELDSNRRELEASQQDLQKANAQLEQRRQQIETILENIPTGVLSLSPEQEIVHANLAFTRMLAPRARMTLTGTRLAEHFPTEVLDDLSKLMRKADRMGSSTAQMELPMSRGRMNAAVTVASLNHDGRRLGYVIVVEDLSDVLKAQRQAAWREVARRVAHEIKNPLTPIALSAERIQRHMERTDPASLSVIRSCADTIAGSVETVRALVDEFATLARFPIAQPQLSSINSVVEAALALFNGRLAGIAVQTFFAPDVPRIMIDPEAMKRAVANLVDNAAEAMTGSVLKEIHISTALLADREAVEIIVADTGHGVTAEAKEKLFLPYFSTKGRGSGLGLAIVSRVVEEHHGSIRVEENKPLGSRFIIELPVISEAAAVARA